MYPEPFGRASVCVLMRLALGHVLLFHIGAVLVFFFGSRSTFSLGAAIAGWFALKLVCGCRAVWRIL
jgi:hypothetical protein